MLDMPRPEASNDVAQWAGSYLPRCYDMVGLVDLRSPRQTDFCWDADANRKTPQARSHIVVLRRKPEAKTL